MATIIPDELERQGNPTRPTTRAERVTGAPLILPNASALSTINPATLKEGQEIYLLDNGSGVPRAYRLAADLVTLNLNPDRVDINSLTSTVSTLPTKNDVAKLLSPSTLLNPQGLFVPGNVYTNNSGIQNGLSDLVIGSNGKSYVLIGTTGAYSTQPQSDPVNWRPATTLSTLDVVPNTKLLPLQRTLRQVFRISTNSITTVTQLRVLNIGDSLAGCAQFLLPQLIAQLGWVGWFAPIVTQTLIAGPVVYGAATFTSSALDFTVTPTGDYATLAANGDGAGNGINVNGNSTPYLVQGDTYSMINATRLRKNIPRCNLFKGSFIGGGGVIKAQYSCDYGLNWNDVSSLTAVDTSTFASGTLQTVTGAFTECNVTTVRWMRVSGTTRVYAVGAESTTRSGVVASCFHKGSIQIGSDGFAGGNGATALITSCAPDLVTCCSLDGTVINPTGAGGIVPAMQALNTIFDSLTIIPDVIWYGIPNTQGDSFAATTTYNQAMLAVARFKKQAFVDTFSALGMWARANSLGLFGDSTHPNTIGWALVHQEFMQQFGYNIFAFGQSWQPAIQSYRNLWLGNMGMWPNGTSFTPSATGVNSIMPGLCVTVPGGFPGTVACSRVLLDQVEDPSADQYGFTITTTGAVGPSITFKAGPARRSAGQQVTCTFKAKSLVDGLAFAIFATRYSGSGSLAGDALNQPAVLSSAYKEFSICLTTPMLLSANESINSTLEFAIASFLPGTITIKDVRIYNGPIGEPVNVPVLCDTFEIDFPSISANSISNAVTVTVLGAEKGGLVKVQRPPTLTSGVMIDAAVTANDTVSIWLINCTTAPIDPPILNYVVTLG